MNKIQGKETDFAPIKEDASRVIICYGYEDISKEDATWLEVYLYKKQHPQVTLSDVKAAIIDDINARTEKAIISGFVWQGKPVWLSVENQGNFAVAERRAVATGDNLPWHTKIGEQEDGTPVYHDFATAAELTEFWNACQDHITACRQAGWSEKDAMDWKPYEEWFGIGSGTGTGIAE